MTDKTRLIVLIISTLLIIVADICISISITLEKTLAAVLTIILTLPMICVNIYTIVKLTKN